MDTGPLALSGACSGAMRHNRAVTLWSGRVGASLDPAVWELLRANDAELLPYDCEATAEHAGRLHGAGLLDAAELAEVEERLAEIAQDPSAILDADEDVHSAIERLLGPVGRKIHAGRSRNDQVAAAFRLYVRDACAEAREEIDALALVTLSFAEAEADTLMPGLHAPPARPARDARPPPPRVGGDARPRPDALHGRGRGSLDQPSRGRARSRARRSGSTRPWPRCGTRSTRWPIATSPWTTSTRPRCSPSTSPGSSEEIVLWSTAEFGFVKLPENASTGSSMMPQKLNPDVAELVRGKGGTAIGRLAGLLATVKGLPLAYDRDLQEDKAPVFGARQDVRLSLRGMTVLVSGLVADRERLAEAAADPLLLATDVAEDLVRGGIPFRDAHEQVAASVRDGTFASGTTPAESVAARGAPGPGGVREAITAARRRFGQGL